MFTMSSNRFTGILRTESASTKRVSMLRMGSWNGRDATGIATTALVAASIAAARAYGRKAACMAPPFVRLAQCVLNLHEENLSPDRNLRNSALKIVCAGHKLACCLISGQNCPTYWTDQLGVGVTASSQARLP